MDKMKLYGFNNLTKSLSFNIYDVCYANSKQEQAEYIEYIDEQYNSERLTQILINVTEMIGATVLNIARQDYEPQGSSVTILIAEESQVQSESVVAHLDKSHVTVHTYPEYHPDNAISTFRVDIDVATCGKITPLSVLDYLIASFDSDIITLDYKVRGFTRDIFGDKHYMDHKIRSIQDFIEDETLAKYNAIDVNVYQYNIFHTRLILKDLVLKDYLFKHDVDSLSDEVKEKIEDKLKLEMHEIFSGVNIGG